MKIAMIRIVCYGAALAIYGFVFWLLTLQDGPVDAVSWFVRGLFIGLSIYAIPASVEGAIRKKRMETLLDAGRITITQAHIDDPYKDYPLPSRYNGLTVNSPPSKPKPDVPPPPQGVRNAKR